ncbi:hypothetical protein CYMTET_34474, partial [Cymbomonas tetramitiformis]|eukprot:gene6132-7355_t
MVTKSGSLAAAISATFVAQLTFTAVFLVLLLVRKIREQVLLPRIYAEKSSISPKECAGIFGWFKHFWSRTEEEILDDSGLDAVVLLRIVKMFFIFFLRGALYDICFVLPVGAIDGKGHIDDASDDLGRFGIQGFTYGSEQHWATVVSAFVSAANIGELLWTFTRDIAKMQKNEVTKSALNFGGAPEDFAVLVTHIQAPGSEEEGGARFAFTSIADMARPLTLGGQVAEEKVNPGAKVKDDTKAKAAAEMRDEAKATDKTKAEDEVKAGVEVKRQDEGMKVKAKVQTEAEHEALADDEAGVKGEAEADHETVVEDTVQLEDGVQRKDMVKAEATSVKTVNMESPEGSAAIPDDSQQDYKDDIDWLVKLFKGAPFKMVCAVQALNPEPANKIAAEQRVIGPKLSQVKEQLKFGGRRPKVRPSLMEDAEDAEEYYSLKLNSLQDGLDSLSTEKSMETIGRPACFLTFKNAAAASVVSQIKL